MKQISKSLAIAIFTIAAISAFATVVAISSSEMMSQQVSAQTPPPPPPNATAPNATASGVMNYTK